MVLVTTTASYALVPSNKYRNGYETNPPTPIHARFCVIQLFLLLANSRAVNAVRTGLCTYVWLPPTASPASRPVPEIKTDIAGGPTITLIPHILRATLTLRRHLGRLQVVLRRWPAQFTGGPRGEWCRECRDGVGRPGACPAVPPPAIRAVVIVGSSDVDRSGAEVLDELTVVRTSLRGCKRHDFLRVGGHLRAQDSVIRAVCPPSNRCPVGFVTGCSHSIARRSM